MQNKHVDLPYHICREAALNAEAKLEYCPSGNWVYKNFGNLGNDATDGIMEVCWHQWHMVTWFWATRIGTTRICALLKSVLPTEWTHTKSDSIFHRDSPWIRQRALGKDQEDDIQPHPRIS